ncbi:MAG: hypothetical protein DCC73_11585 [Proteobacteria bacterium]|nr:MAG: hypothetical protein DCC73_11585 [Pseudomonadota bacterium]
MTTRPMKAIPVSAAEKIAKAYGYDQIVIIGRRVGEEHEPHGEHVTTYGMAPDHCQVAARMGDFLKFKIMQWPPELAEKCDACGSLYTPLALTP